MLLDPTPPIQQHGADRRPSAALLDHVLPLRQNIEVVIEHPLRRHAVATPIQPWSRLLQNPLHSDGVNSRPSVFVFDPPSSYPSNPSLCRPHDTGRCNSS